MRNWAVISPIVCVLTVGTSIGYAADHPDHGRSTAKQGRTPTSNSSEMKLVEDSKVSSHHEQSGIMVDLTVSTISGRDEDRNSLTPRELMAGRSARVDVRLTDAKTGKPLTERSPRAWFSMRRSESVANEFSCRDKIKSLLKGHLGTRPEVDLNSYALYVLNHDHSISVINPQVAFSQTKLEKVILLPGQGADWAFTPDKAFLYVTIPDRAAVAVIQTATGTLSHVIQTGEVGKPRRLAMQPDAKVAWIGLDETATVVAIDTQSHTVLGTIPVGQGLHALAVTDDSRFVLVTNSAEDTVTVIDASTLTPLASVEVGQTPVGVTYNAISRRAYVSSVNDGMVSVIDPTEQRVVQMIPVGRGGVALRFEPSGRYGFVVSQLEHKVFVFDAMINQVIVSGAVTKEPDQVTFSRHHAYVRGVASEKISLIELGPLGKGQFLSTEIPAGQLAPSAAVSELNIADMIVPTPEGHGAMIANAPDQTIYYYMEGMMVPMGTFQTYKRMPRGVMVLDRSLSETSPGVYSAVVTLPKAGRFDVPLLLDHPRVSHCFQVTITDPPDRPVPSHEPSLTIETLFSDRIVPTKELASFQFKITDRITHKPVVSLNDVEALFLEPPGTWQRRKWATHLGDGIYVIETSFPHAGQYNILLQVPSRRMKYSSRPSETVTVVDGASMNGGPSVSSRQ